MYRKTKWFLFFSILIYAFSSYFSSASAQELKSFKVLILNSYNKSFKWTEDITNAIINGLRQKDMNIDICIENMDTKKMLDQQYFNLLFDLYRYKYANQLFDLIISTDDNAFNFLIEKRDDLFPNVPVVFCGVNFFKTADLKDKKLFTGVNEEADFAENIALILKLHPDIKQIVIINDTAQMDRKTSLQLQEAMKQYKDEVQFSVISDVQHSGLLARLDNLGPHTAILFLPFFKDGALDAFAYSDFLKQLSSQIKVPIYSAWDFLLGHGIMGGFLTSGSYQGEVAAKLALRILKNENIDKIPIVQKVPKRYMFDYNQLKMYQFKLEDLPQGSVIINQPSRDGRYLRVAGLVSIAVLLGAIIFLEIVILLRGELKR